MKLLVIIVIVIIIAVIGSIVFLFIKKKNSNTSWTIVHPQVQAQYDLIKKRYGNPDQGSKVSDKGYLTFIWTDKDLLGIKSIIALADTPEKYVAVAMSIPNLQGPFPVGVLYVNGVLGITGNSLSEIEDKVVMIDNVIKWKPIS